MINMTLASTQMTPIEAIADGPALLPVKPDCVPPLDLEGLPGYETSSDEAEEEDDDQEPPPDYLSQ